jgi:DNA-binding SARP family transcriptional activator/tetratricopeptide (TPR) repeat protein
VLRLWLCGRLAGELDGEPVSMPSSERAQALIGWLALHPGPRPRADVATRLWPETSEARANLRTAIWAVRRAWGGAAVYLDGQRNLIGLTQSGVWVDATADPPVGVPLPDGELLPGLDDEWLEAERESYRRRQLSRLAGLARDAEAAGNHSAATQWAAERSRLAPLDESAHREFLRLLAMNGDIAGAVLEGHRFAERLRSELGVDPSPATRAAQAALQAPIAQPARTPLFGRSAELHILLDAWRAAARGRGQIVVLTGEAGIGKTSVVAELARRATMSGARTAIGAGIDVGGETPFAVWLELARALVPTVRPVPRAAAWPGELNRLSDDLGARLGQPDPPVPVAAPELERLRVFEAILRLVEWASADRPLLIAVDDAHRADRASLRLTAHIARRVATLPILLVLTRRDRPARTELDALIADLASRQVPSEELHLGPISDADIAALATSVASGLASRGLPEDSIRRVISAADGNPLFAVESARALAAGQTAPPPNLRTAVRVSVASLSEPGRTLVRLLAVAGRPLTRTELDNLAPDVDSRSATEEAVLGSGLVVAASGGLGYRHALLREAVCAEIPDPAPLHDRLAEALDPGDHAGIARHLQGAGRLRAAAVQWAAAAAYARSVGAAVEAAELLDRALSCTPEDGSLWLELSQILAWLGRDQAMEEAWRKALALLPSDRLAAAWSRRGRQMRTVTCNPEEAFAAYLTAESLLWPDAPSEERAAVLIGLAWRDAVGADARQAERLLTMAEEELARRADPVTVLDMTEIRMQSLIRQGRFAEAASVAWEASRTVPDTHGQGPSYGIWVNAACALTSIGDYEGALACAEQGVVGTRDVPVILVHALAAKAHILTRLERFDEALAVIAEQRRLAERLDSPVISATSAFDAGLVTLAAARFAEAAGLFSEALAGPAQISRPAAGIARAEALACAGDIDGAKVQLRAAVTEPVRPADQPWSLVPKMSRVQALIATGSGDRLLAVRRYEEAEAAWRRILPSVTTATSEGYFANLVDLGRPPVVGLVEPARELARIERERAALLGQ